jgi:hypothetical protein
MEEGRRVEPYELDLIVREQSADYGLDEDDDEGFERIPDQSKPTRTLWRDPLTEDEKTDSVNWMIQRIRCLARIPEGRPPTQVEMVTAAAMMMCLIWIIDNPAPSDEEGAEESAAYFDLSVIAVGMDVICIAPSNGLAYVRQVAHELAHRLMIAEVAAELFWAAEVCIEAPGWDNERERHKLARRVEDGLMQDR